MNAGAAWQFQVFNFPVRVHLSFFLVTLLIGLSYNNLVLLLLWVVVVFFSILLHELGHAVIADRYGRAPSIELYSMGGLTVPNRYSVLSYPQEILLSFAGPLAGFLLGGLVFLLLRVLGPVENFYLRIFFGMLLWVNIGWGIFNLIPILPLDGGSIMRNLYHWLRNPRDERTPLLISIVFGILTILAAIYLRQFFVALLIGWLTYNNFTAYQRGYWTDRFV